MTEKLKPCPFCGSTKLKIDSKRTFNYNKRHCSVTVRCMKCHARSPVVGISMDKNQYNERELCESQVTEAWNRRKFQNTETCVCCGTEIPEGRQVCPACENGEDK